MDTQKPATGSLLDRIAARECQERLYNGTVCRRSATTTVPLDFTHERKPVCERHARSQRFAVAKEIAY